MVRLVKISKDDEVRCFEVNAVFPYGEGKHTFPKGTDLHSCHMQIFADALWDWTPGDWINPVGNCGCYILASMAEEVLEWIEEHVVKWYTKNENSGSDDANEVVLHVVLV